MRLLPSLTRLGAALLITSPAACRESTGPAEDAEVRVAAETLSLLADSLYRSGGDPIVANSYGRLSSFLNTGGQATPVTIVVDGVPRTFLAMAQSAEPNQIVCVTAPCPQLPSFRTMVAWRRNDPRQIVQLTAVTGAPIGAPVLTPTDRYSSVATLTWLDGRGGFYIGTSGTQTVRLDRETDTPCANVFGAKVYTSSSFAPSPTSCVLADFTVSFDATLQPPSARGPRNNAATGTHTLGMRAQPVTGAVLRFLPGYICGGCPIGEYPYPFVPPVDITPRTYLFSALTATVVTNVVTLTYTIKNTGTTPEVIQLPTSQRYDFAIATLPAFNVAWRWSANRSFAQVLGTITLAPSEQIVFTEQWTPTHGGDFIAYAQLASTTHNANSAVAVHVPGFGPD